MNKSIVGVVLFVLLAIGFTVANKYMNGSTLPEGFASGNGRLEANEFDVASKLPGRVAEVFVQEGDQVQHGQILALLDTRELDARLNQAEAQVEQARQSKNFALAVVRQRKSELALAKKNLQRSKNLYQNRSIPLVQLQQIETTVLSAEAGVAAAEAQVVMQEAAIKAAIAQANTIKTHRQDSIFRAPISGRILYRLVEPGEVIGMGGRILTVLDLTDVYMNLYLPTTQAGNVALGAEARIVLDARPNENIPAKVKFVAPRAQFTPRQVETRSEREKLMFRVKVKIDQEYLQKNINQIKTGLPGVAYIRLDENKKWPDELGP